MLCAPAPSHFDGLLRDSLQYGNVCSGEPKSGHSPSDAISQHQAGRNNCLCGPAGYSLANKAQDAAGVHCEGTLLTCVQHFAYQDAHVPLYRALLPSVSPPKSGPRKLLRCNFYYSLPVTESLEQNIKPNQIRRNFRSQKQPFFSFLLPPYLYKHIFLMSKMTHTNVRRRKMKMGGWVNPNPKKSAEVLQKTLTGWGISWGFAWAKLQLDRFINSHNEPLGFQRHHNTEAVHTNRSGWRSETLTTYLQRKN